MKIYFEIPGKPVAKGRPRATRRGNFVAMYTPKKTVAFENLVKTCFCEKYPLHEPISEMVHVEIKTIFPALKAANKSDRDLMESGLFLPHPKKPDLDNIVKSVCDALNDIAFVDDNLVQSLSASKWYGSRARTEITIATIGESNE